MRAHVLFRTVSLCAVPCALASCATLSRQAFSPPEVTVTDMRLAGIGFDGGRIDVFVSLYNPNRFRLDASQIRYRLLVDTIEVATGSIDQHINLGGKDSIALRIPVSFGLREVASANTMFTERGSVPFQLTGDLRVITPFGSLRRPFDQRGTYDGVVRMLRTGREE